MAISLKESYGNLSFSPTSDYSGQNLKPGYYRLDLNKTLWEIPSRYTNLQPLGHGAYGSVCSATDNELGVRVAIKKLIRPFQSDVHAKRSYRELKLLKHMNHENIICLIDVFSPQTSLESFADLYLVTPLMGADMNTIVKTQRLSDDHIQFLIYQILRALKYLHSAGIIHRDLKPSNIAVNEDCELKILDFGLARQQDSEMTGYVATRWYRASEIMLNWMHYNHTVDIWSVGCIMGEMIACKVLFPGTDHIDQLSRIMQLLGKPDKDFLAKITSEDARNYIASLPDMRRQSFERFFEGANPLAIDLLDKMLKMDPDERISAADALKHPYFQQYHDPNDEPDSEPFIDQYENSDFPVNQWRELIWENILTFKPKLDSLNLPMEGLP